MKRLTPGSAEDFFRFFEHIAFADHPEWGCDCYCCFFHADDAAEWEGRTAAQNRKIAGDMISLGKMNGLLAYADHEPVGWCNFDAKSKFPGLKLFYPQVIGDGEEDDIGAVVCFTVAQGFRGQGIARKMLEQACAELKDRGLSIVEAYPATECASDEQNYHGPLGMYLSQGFSVYRRAEKVTVVRKTLR